MSVWRNRGFTEDELSRPAKLIIGLCIAAWLLLEALTATANAVQGVVPRPSCSAVILVGFLLFLFPKLHVVRHTRRISFGSALMTEGQGNLYRFGYFLMGAGSLLTFR